MGCTRGTCNVIFIVMCYDMPDTRASLMYLVDVCLQFEIFQSMGDTWHFPCDTGVTYFIVTINDHSYFKSLVGHEDMTNFHGRGCCDPQLSLHDVTYLCIVVGIGANRALCICRFMNLHPKYMGTSECRK